MTPAYRLPRHLLAILILIQSTLGLSAEIILPPSFSDGMVLQRPDRSIPSPHPLLWGWCDAAEEVTVQVGGKPCRVRSDKDSFVPTLRRWRVDPDDLSGKDHDYGPTTIELQIYRRSGGLLGKRHPVGTPKILSAYWGEVWILATKPHFGLPVDYRSVPISGAAVRICKLDDGAWLELTNNRSSEPQKSWLPVGPGLTNLCAESVGFVLALPGLAPRLHPIGIIPIPFEQPQRLLNGVTAAWTETMASTPERMVPLLPLLRMHRNAALEAWLQAINVTDQMKEQFHREGKIYDSRAYQAPQGRDSIRYVEGGFPAIPHYVRGAIY